jgi:hypothetical protein
MIHWLVAVFRACVITGASVPKSDYLSFCCWCNSNSHELLGFLVSLKVYSTSYPMKSSVAANTLYFYTIAKS